MRGIPQGHDAKGMIRCDNCKDYHLQENCRTEVLIGVLEKERQFTSNYNDRSYWLSGSWDEVTMWQCPGCTQWMRDPNDDDPRTPHTYHVVPWKCGECGDIFPYKDEADECCS